MERLPASRKNGAYLLVAAFILFLSTGCGSPERPSPLPTLTRPAATPIQALIETQGPTATSIASPTAPPSVEVGPTVTSPLLVPTVPLVPSMTPTPPAEPTIHIIESGNTLLGIAESYGVTLDALLLANGTISTAELPLVIGSGVQIPLCEAHQIMPGNTITAIANLCGLTIDELVTANVAGLAPLGSLDAVPLGYVLMIPSPSSILDESDCSVFPPREQVIEHMPGPGEGIYCLSQMFGVSTAAILQGNFKRLAANEFGQVPLLIPPVDGAIYVVTAEDIEAGIDTVTLADWYDATPDAVTDWNGNPLFGPLTEGQQLLISGANLSYGVFRLPSPESDVSSDENSN
jgi:hypothetical protein